MKTYIHLQHRRQDALRADLAGDDVRYPDALVRCFLEEYTRPGDVVFDPFAGFGTTLRVAEEMGRTACGLEYDRWRCDYARSCLRHPENLVGGDARRLSTYNLPPVNFSITSPPYTSRDGSMNPFTAYSTPGRGYETYLQDMQDVYRQLAAILTDEALAVVEVANLKGESGLTTLAWDVAHTIGGVMRFEGEVIVCWEPTYGYGYDHSYCLLFRRL